MLRESNIVVDRVAIEKYFFIFYDNISWTGKFLEVCVPCRIFVKLFVFRNFSNSCLSIKRKHFMPQI